MIMENAVKVINTTVKALFSSLILIGFFSCASAPPPEEPPPAPAPVEEPKELDVSAERARALEARQKAQSIKAEVAVAEAFSAAQSVLDDAEALASSASSGAVEKFLDAEKRFLAAYDEAYVKREEAQRQLDMAWEAVRKGEE
jgi:hypothetical protein